MISLRNSENDILLFFDCDATVEYVCRKPVSLFSITNFCEQFFVVLSPDRYGYVLNVSMIRYSYLESGICHDLFKAPGHRTKVRISRTASLLCVCRRTARRRKPTAPYGDEPT